jgi:peptidyl-dipeptidase A
MKLQFTGKIAFFLAISALFALTITGCGKKQDNTKAKMEEVKKMETELTDFIKQFEAKFKPIYNESNELYFAASCNANKDNFAKLNDVQMKMNEILSNKEDFAKLKRIKGSGLIQDSTLKRELVILYNEYYLPNQVDTAKLNKMTVMQNQIEEKFSNFRAVVNGKELDDNAIEDILKNSKDSKKLEAAWLAHKKVGEVVQGDIIALVKLRNEVAKELGFANYHEMMLTTSEQDPKEISSLFDELDKLTSAAFAKEKQDMDVILSAQYKIKPEEMMPWHYQNRFFQEAPKIYKVDLDKYFKKVDLVKTTIDYYKGIGIDIQPVVDKSDLFGRKNKNQHAFMINCDRDAKTVRVLCNVTPCDEWMGTLLHEFGHSSYERYMDDNMPWLFKEPAHTFTTEAIAMFFGRLSTNPQWLQDAIGIKPEEKDKIADDCRKTLRLQQLVFSRWSQVMYRFEKSMYENPDQDLNKLWWDLVEKYQLLKRPEGRNAPDWASKIHIATSPCYYHNYHLGELMASQLYYTLVDKVLKEKDPNTVSFTNRPEIGQFLINNIYKVGKKYTWNDMIEKATGEKLTPKYYAKQFVQQ